MSFGKTQMPETDGNSPVSPDRKSGYVFLILTVFLFAAFGFQLWYFAVRTSATVDEPTHILAGHRHWQCADFGINPEHPPLLKLLATLPLNFRTLKEPPWECGSRMTSKPDSFLFGTKFVIENGVDTVVIPVRLAAALVSVALAVLVFAATRRMFGRAEALTALALLSFEPNLIANGALVTTDMVVTTTTFAAMAALYFFCRVPSLFRFVLAGLAAGLLLAAKHSAVIFLPAFFALIIADPIFFRRPEAHLKRLILVQSVAFAGIFLIAFITLWAFYGFRYRSIPATDAGTVSAADYIALNGRPETINSFSAKIAISINQTHIFPESYMLGVADIVATGSRNAYIFNRAYPTGQCFAFLTELSLFCCQ